MTTSKRKALQDCLDLWIWLYKTGSIHKSGYPPYADAIAIAGTKTDANTPLHYCPACDYTKFKDEYHDSYTYYPDCTICPLNGFAWPSSPIKTFPCENDPESPYKAWLDARGNSVADCRGAALKMIEKIEEALSNETE